MAKKHHFVVDMVIPQYLRMFDDCERVTIRKKSYILCKNAKVSELCQHFGLDEPEMIHLSQGTFGIPSEIRIKPNPEGDKWTVLFDISKTKYADCKVGGCKKCVTFAPISETLLCVCGHGADKHNVSE